MASVSRAVLLHNLLCRCTLAQLWHNWCNGGKFVEIGALKQLQGSVQLAAAALETTRKPWLFHHWEMA